MKILFDTQIFDWQINGGISRYFIEVLQRLEQNKEMEVLFRCRHSYNTYIQGTHWLAGKPKVKNIHFKGKLSLLKIINQWVNRPYADRLLKKGVPDIFHPTYFDPYFLKYLGKKPLVLTVYDLTIEKFNDNLKRTGKVLGWKKNLIEAADHIIAISENTRKDIIDFYEVAPGKVTTIYLAGGFDPAVRNASPVEEMGTVPGRFILFVGSRTGYKNFAAFVKEVAPLLKKENISLVLAGGGMINASEANLLKEWKIEDKLLAFPHVSDVFLAQLYKKAIVFIFPSIYEGFGLPVLEAMQCGCPALLSNNSSLPEVGAGAAAYFDPFTEGSLRDRLARLLNNEEERKEMITQGWEQVKKFNWDRTAEEHVKVYKRLLV